MKILKVTLLVILFSTPVLLHSQLSLGFKGGYTMAWEYYNTTLPDGAEISVNGSHVGGLVYGRLGKRLSLGIEPGYVRRGAACVPGWMPVFEGDSKYFLHYIEAPVMLKANFPICKNRLEVFGKLGYGASVMFKAMEEVILTGNFNPEPRSKIGIGEVGQLNRIDHGAYSSIGFGWNVGGGQLFSEASYYFGMRDAEKGNTSKNRSLNVSLGYSIPLCQKAD